MKRCIFIIGMHRSGTSATAGMLHKGGLCLGKNLMEPDWINPTGYFEDEKVIAINTALYDFYKASLWYPPYMQDDEGQFELTFRQFIDYYNDIDVVAFKNPRFCATFPIWLWYLGHDDIEIQIIILRREPRYIVKSLMRTRNMPESVANAIVNMHISHLDRIEREYPSLIAYRIFYEVLIDEPKQIYNLLSGNLELDLNPDGYKHIDRTLKHF